MARRGESHCNAHAGRACAIEEHRGPAPGPTFFPSGSEAARLMAEIDAGALPVGEDDRLVGMITDRDT